jgi:hypothetical protein
MLLQTNCDTGEQLPEQSTQRIMWVIDRLQLSQQQQHNIAQGAALARKLLTPLLLELQQLQLQQGAAAADAQGSSHSNGAAGAADAAASAAAAAETDAAGFGQLLTSSLAYRKSLQQQRQRSDRMRVLMGKVSGAADEDCALDCALERL